MRIAVDSFWLAKRGNLADEYEDAVWPARSISGEFDTFRMAVADGATETSFSGLWARLLVQSYRLGYLEKYLLHDGLDSLRRCWKERIGSKPLPWYAEQKLELGAFAAVVGLRLERANGMTGRWKALAIGDACLFQVRHGRLINSFPLSSVDSFDSRPVLLSSIGTPDNQIENGLVTARGTWDVGDTFYLMSDALACWFLRRWQLPNGDPLEFVNSITTNADFTDFIDFQRGDLHEGMPMLKNDDVTMLRCSLNR